MALRNLEKIKSTLVLLPPEGEFVFNFDPNEISKYLRDPVPQQTPLGLQITSVRDQIVVTLSQRIMFEDQSDIEPSSSGRFPDAVSGFLGMLTRQGITRFRAYGWNFECSFDAPGELPAAALIADTFLQAQPFKERAGISPKGAGLHVQFEQGQARCQLQLAPKNMDLNTQSLYSAINYHYDLSEGALLPDLGELRIAYHGLWGSFNDLLRKLVKA